MSLHQKTLTELKALLDQRDISSVELTQHYLQRLKTFNPDLNSVITLTEQSALDAAHQADQRRVAESDQPLLGLPIVHKDIFCTEGVRTTCGSRMLENFIAPYESTCTANMQQAGMVMLGKSNMDEFAMGSSNETSYFGPVANPWDHARVPGGSSGGAAATMGARLAPAVTGTDTGGSIRQPAALCNVTGLKPTYGRVSRYGMIAFASSLDQAGPMAASAEDCAWLLGAMAGFDQRDSTSADQPVPDYAATLNDSIKGLKIGLPTSFFDTGLDAGVEQAIRSALTEYEKMGAELVDIELPNMHLSVPAYYVIAPAECSSNLSRFDGVRFGHRADNPKNLDDLYKRSRGEGFGAEVKRRIMIGTYALSAGYYDAYYLKAQKIRQLISHDFSEAFKQVDVIMGPTAPDTAFNAGEKAADPIAMYLSDIYTIAVNLAGLPGMSIPAGFVDGLPTGLQLIGNYFDEARLLSVAHHYQQVTDWHQQMPSAYR